MQRVLATFLALSAALAAQDPALPSLELPRTEAWFDDPEHGNAPTALVVVKRGHAPWIRTTGCIDAGEEVPLRPDSWIPLGQCDDLLLREAVRIERDQHGLDLTATLAASAPSVVAGLDPRFGALTWSGLLIDHRTPAPLYWRGLASGEVRRPLAEVIAAHAFPDPRRPWSDGDMWRALVQHALETRRGTDWATLVAGPIAASLKASFSVVRPDDSQHWYDGDSGRSVRDSEVAANGVNWLRLDTVPHLLEELLRRDAGQLDDKALGGFRPSGYRREGAEPIEYRSLWGQGLFEIHMDVWTAQGIAMFRFGWHDGPRPKTSALHDLFGPPPSTPGQTWLAARGLDRAPKPTPLLAEALVGAWSGTARTLYGEIDVRLEVADRDAGTSVCSLDGARYRQKWTGDGLRLDGSVWPGIAAGDRRWAAEFSIHYGFESALRFDLDLVDGRLVGTLDETGVHYALPWPIELVRARSREPEEPVQRR